MSLCRNKSKYEYTLQGWKAFALSHSVRSGDRLQIELLPDGRRMRADIVKRASPKDRASAEVGPASPAVMDVASVAKPSSGVTSWENVYDKRRKRLPRNPLAQMRLCWTSAKA